jgi:cyclophilin family peptidyl-prolyl cis-trans isomerase
MKRLLIALPLTIAMAGCGNAGDNTASTSGNTLVARINANAASVSPANAATPKATGAKTTGTKTTGAKSTPQPGGTRMAEAPAETDNGGKTYKVVDEAQPGMTADVAAALKKEKVPPPPASMPTPVSARLLLTTSKGPITVELDGKAAPLHVKSFVYLAKRGFYNNTIFHRYEPGFVVQGGDPLTRHPDLEANWGQGGPGYQIPLEISDLKHDALVIAMARSGDPDSAGSQFYITLKPTHQLDGQYTVFGKVVDGKDTVAKMAKGDKLISVKVLSVTNPGGKKA